MRDYEGIFKNQMNAVIYCTFSGQCRAAAEKLGAKLNFAVKDYADCDGEYENAVLIFPVHCQGLPPPFKKFLKGFMAERITFIALYGRMGAGNAIYEAFKITGNAVAAAYLPANHTYCEKETDLPDIPDNVINKILNPDYISLPKRLKAPFAEVFPAARSRALVKIIKNDKCVECGLCDALCPLKSMRCGKTGRDCMRCMKCVYSCPVGALKIKKSAVIKKYLAKPRFCKTIVYV